MNEKPAYTDLNAQVIGGWIENGWEWGRPIEHEAFEAARQGNCRLC